MSLPLDGKIAVITGSGTGLGAAIARRFATDGARVVISDINAETAKATADTIDRAIAIPADVTDEHQVQALVDQTVAEVGGLHIMVANAGVGTPQPLLETSLADWRRTTSVNLDGVFLSIKHAIPALRRAGGGSIVLMSSIAGLRGSAGLAGYSATKGGVRLLAKSVALEHAADKIRCNSVHPGIIATPIWGKLPAGALERRNAPVDPHELAGLAVPLVRAGQARDIANGVLFLCSEAASYITGQELVIDGGMMAGGRPSPRT